MKDDLKKLADEAILGEVELNAKFLGLASQLLGLQIAEIKKLNLKESGVHAALHVILRRLETDVSLVTAAIARIEAAFPEQNIVKTANIPVRKSTHH